MNIPSPISDIPRYLQHPFPAYRYVPGCFPHPFRSKLGHHHKYNLDMQLQDLTEEERYVQLWIHGCDLFAYRYYWEAHEVWEDVWKYTETPRKQEIQAAIKMAASILKRHMNHIDASAKLWRQSFEKLQNSTDTYLVFWREKVQLFHKKNDWQMLELDSHEKYPIMEIYTYK